MKTIHALKCILLIIVFFSSAQLANAQAQDTTFYFFRAIGLGKAIVRNIDSADYIEVIPPYRLADQYVDIHEYYKNGNTKFTGKAITSTINFKTGYAEYDGPCVYFYPTGKREVITTYHEGVISGPQYFYYPDGKLRMVLNNLYKQRYTLNGAQIVDFYDKTGVQLCKDGNGTAINYDTDFNEISRGPVKKGKKDGEWQGMITDGIEGKYSLFFKENVYVSGIGYEASTKKSYLFVQTYVPATPPVSPVYFIIKFKDHIKLPPGTSITKKMIDSTLIYFTVEEDGQLTHFETIEPVPGELLEALKVAFTKCQKWAPAKVYGIPVQTQIALSLAIQTGVRYNSNDKGVERYQMVLYKGIPLKSVPAIRTTF
jgi:hypothetical protein